MDYKGLGQKVKTKRKTLGITQERTAESAGISAVFWGHIERGTRILSVETLRSICKVLDMSADFLIGLENKKER